MQSNSVNGQPDIANITVVTDERQVIVPQAITSVVEVNNPGPQGPVGPTGPQGPSVPFTNIGNDVYATTSSLQVTGSFLVSGSSTFTNIGPAVFSGSVNATSGVTMSSALVSGDVTVLGTASINVLQINTTINSTGSNTLGDSANDTQTLYGTVVVPTGSLTVSGNVSFGTSSAGFYWNNTNNRLGIGTSSPASALHVNGEIRVNAGQAVFLDVSNNIYVLGAGNQFRIYSGGTASLNIATNGNTLIGTTVDAGAKFYISGSTSQALLIASSSAGPALYVSGSGNVGIGTSASAYTLTVKQPSNSTSTGFQITQTDGASSGMVLQHINNVAIIKNRVTGDLTLGTNDSERLRILSAGNIGINTVSPTSQLQVKGSGATSATTTLRVENTNASASLVVRDDGFVGIGTTAPSGRLDVSAGLGTQTAGDLVVDTTNNIVYVGKLDSASGNTNLIFRNRLGGVKSKWANAGAGSIWFGDFVSGYGVGIQQSGITTETTLPGSAIFHVDKGTLGGTVASFINGNVGIGTTSPSTTLDVSGSGRFTSNLTITGSATISNILTLTPQSPLPSGVATGSFAVSSSVPPKPYFYDGTTWNALY